MNISFRYVFMGLLLIAFLSSSVFAEQRIATIDLNKAFSNYWKKKEAEANLKEEQANMEKVYKGYVEDVKKAKETYQKLLNDANDQAVSPDEREKRKNQAEQKYKDWKDAEDRAVAYNKQASTTLEEKSRRVRERILGEIQEVIKAKAAASGFAMVFDSAAESRNFTPVILFNNKEYDITDQVLDQLNAAAPAASAAPATGNSEDKKKDQKRDSKGK